MSSNFDFLLPQWPELHEAATKAEQAVHSDARAAGFQARRTLELWVAWLFKHDAALTLPWDDKLDSLLRAPSLQQLIGAALVTKADLIRRLGNQAAHSPKPFRTYDALTVLRELFHLCFWLARTYGRGAKPDDGLSFDPARLPPAREQIAQSLEQLQRLETALRERDERLKDVVGERVELDAELKRVRAELAATKTANAARPDEHDYSEAETRDRFIDLLLREAGWPLDQSQDREYEVAGMPNTQEKGYVDYVLWGDDGRPLALVEAKRTKRDPRVGQRQAELYADCLEKRFGRRPLIFYTNGYEHWLWDDLRHPPRPVQGFYKKDELELLMQRRETRKPLGAAPINAKVAGRHYQMRAIRRIGESFERDRRRKALVVMATGAGKTRTVIALCDLLMRCNWVKRVLFLADRVALVNQAVGAFKTHLPDAATVNLVTEKATEGRVFVSTYPTMMGLINDTDGAGLRRFGVGHFDLVIIDEAHRSVYQKYRAIFDYFDSYLVGLTATPRDEVDHNTYSLFDLEDGVPTDAYELDEAIADKHLVPPKAVSVPLKFQREGIKYDELPDEEKEQWDELEWEEDSEEKPDTVSAEAVNRWLFNEDTVDKVLRHLMTHGLAVAGGDRLGKTIIFAKNDAHAQFIQQRFDANYPKWAGKFARVITFKTEYAQSLIDAFGRAEDAPHIAISVDMLDTGIDVPEVVNLVFFKLVRSKTKFWQMLGRGTRLCPDLFGPGRDKTHFQVFDFCQNLEYFSQNPETTGGAAGESLGKRLFKARLELIGVLDSREMGGSRQAEEDRFSEAARGLRADLAACLREEVAAMNVDNFVVRPKRRLVEKYRESPAWDALKLEEHGELAREVAGLPHELDPEKEEAKRFDLLLLNLQLALLKQEPAFERLRAQVVQIAGLLEERATIPMIAKQIVLIQEIQTDEWWRDATLTMLETVRRRLRDLVQLIEFKARKPVYSDFEDEIGEGSEVRLGELGQAADLERFREKMRYYLREHLDHIAVHKLRMGVPITATDLAELERLVAASGVATPDDLERVARTSEGLGLFVRSLVGMDRGAAKAAMDHFLSGATVTANQIQFINLIVDHLTEHGVLAPERLYESPFTDVAAAGPEGCLGESATDALFGVLRQIRESATG